MYIIVAERDHAVYNTYGPYNSYDDALAAQARMTWLREFDCSIVMLEDDA